MATTKPKQSTGVNTYDEQFAAMAAQSAVAAAAISGGSARITLKGALKVGDTEHRDGVPVVVLNDLLVNAYYTSAFDPDNPTSPDCYAYSRFNPETRKIEGIDTASGTVEVGPHKDCASPQCESCAKCKWNQFGTATRDGKPAKGKACQNVMHLAALPVGTCDRDGKAKLPKKLDDINGIEVHTLKLAPSSTKLYTSYVGLVASVARRPLVGVFSRLSRENHDIYQHLARWDMLGNVPNEFVPYLLEKAEEARTLLEQPFPTMLERPAAPSKGSGGKTKSSSTRRSKM